MAKALIRESGMLVEIIKTGRRHTRVRDGDGRTALIPTQNIERIAPGDPRRVIPLTPLRNLYVTFRDSPGSTFHQIRQFLQPRHGPRDAEFLIELFGRSVKHFEAYENPLEPFVENKRRTTTPRSTFARDLVVCLKEGRFKFFQNRREARPEFEFVDYEVSPYRTTLSCYENSDSADSSGNGGMDALLLSLHPTPLPAVGEIKSKGDKGATYALIQGMTYAAELVTQHQWKRLRLHYDKTRSICTDSPPCVDVFIILEKANGRDTSADFAYARKLAPAVGRLPGIRHIHFIEAGIVETNAAFPEARISYIRK